MTVSTEVDHNDYTGNGVTTSFPYTFRIFHKSDLVVQVVDLSENITELTLDTDYTVTGAGGYSGGNVILMTALTSGYQISISRELPVTQETDLRNQGKFFAEVHEDAFDKLTMLIQQVRSWFSLALRKPSFVANYYDAMNNYIRNIHDPSRPQDAATKNYVDTLGSENLLRTLRVPETINQLPGVEERKNKMPAFDNAGNAIVVIPPSGSASDVMIELAKPTGAGHLGTSSGETVQQVIDRLYLPNDPRGYGALAGATDNTMAFIQAANASPDGIVIRGGIYNVNTLTINVPIEIEPGSGISVNNGETVTINSNINAGNYRVFYGDGAVSFNQALSFSSEYKNSTIFWFGASGSKKETTCSVLSGSNEVVLFNAEDFVNGQSISIEHAGSPGLLTPPTSITVSASGLNRQGPTGSTVYSYKVSSVDEDGSVSAASDAVTITDGNDTLGKISPLIRGLAFNVVRWDSTINKAAVWRSKSGGPYQLIGVFGMGQSDSIANGVMDAGLPEISIPWVPSQPPSSPLNKRLITTIVDGGGTKNITIDDLPSKSGAGFLVRHDDTTAIIKAMSLSTHITIPPGDYNVTSIDVPSGVLSIYGNGSNSNFIGWGALNAVISCQNMNNGISISRIGVSPTAWHNQIGVMMDNCKKASIDACTLSGNCPVFLSNCESVMVTNNVIDNWIDCGIFDYNGRTNYIQNNIIHEGCEAIPQNASAIQGYIVDTCTYKNNTSYGKHVYSIKIESGNQNIVSGNESYNSWAEAYHLTGSSSGNRINGNTMFGGDLCMDYAISISNDDRNNVVMYGNQISNNYIYTCGTSAIAVCEFGGLNPDISYTVIDGNTVFGANSNNQPSMPEIYIEGQHVHNTYISNHKSFSRPNVDYIVKEVATSYGLPNNTQVGTLFGDTGTAGLASLSGTGSARLAGGGTGL
ncbi:right-handed parallel beta-helix repeat-containing protein [Escherichia coli]|uniref:right-handed parallel beta-helix repeat-containing protein n=1 Tax=Escherichia coli TaxID=562 RepID=UPI0038B721E7